MVEVPINLGKNFLGRQQLFIYSGKQMHSTFKLIRGVDRIVPIAIWRQEQRKTLNLLQCVKEAETKSIES